MKKATMFLAIIFVPVFISGCTSSSGEPFEPAQPADYSGMGWTEAFDALAKKISTEYAFTEWKGINWNSLKDRYRPLVIAAESSTDQKAYYTALRAFALEIPDGHVSLPADTLGFRDEAIGGGFGLALAELDDQTFVASAIIKDGVAAKAGIVSGAKITAWNDTPISTAVSAQSTLWAPRTLPTNDMEKLVQLELLARGAVGATAKVTYQNPGASGPQTTTLTGENDGYISLDAAGFLKIPANSDVERLVEWRTLDSGYGYIRLYIETVLENGKPVSGYPQIIYDKFKAAMLEMVDKKVPGIVLDIRGNHGGSDVLAADLSGFFAQAQSFYEYTEFYNAKTGKYSLFGVDDNGVEIKDAEVYVKPASPNFSGPVAVLVDPVTISSGEGVALGIGRLPQAKVIGFYGTNGSFGMVGDSVTMPGGYKIGFPYGRSLDKDRVIQLDSKNGVGGVAPTLRIPRTVETVVAKAKGEAIELQYAEAWLDSVTGDKAR